MNVYMSKTEAAMDARDLANEHGVSMYVCSLTSVEVYSPKKMSKKP